MENNLNLVIQSLPDSIFNWLANEQLALMILEINKRLKLSEEDGKNEIIPHLILRLCVQDLDPRDFVNELSHELDIGFESAKMLTKELEEKILKPIEAPLKLDAGVDLKMLYLGKAESRIRNQESGIRNTTSDNPSLRRVSTVVENDEAISNTTDRLPRSARNDDNKLSDNPLLNPKSEILNPVPTPSNPLIQKNKTPEVVPLTPFILHEEINPANSPSAKETAKPSFSYKVPISQRPNQPITPPRAQVITPPQQTKYPPMTIAPKIQRVVHYSSFITRPPVILSNAKDLGSIDGDSSPASWRDQNDSNMEIKIPKSKWFV